mmetsp:Transcript_24889/g.55797  ORF Transcript_24889/g.55797 Transcript_24889/m.55797 type:complete len:82 (-) Transcript_24889:602-847(-)
MIDPEMSREAGYGATATESLIYWLLKSQIKVSLSLKAASQSTISITNNAVDEAVGSRDSCRDEFVAAIQGPRPKLGSQVVG